MAKVKHKRKREDRAPWGRHEDAILILLYPEGGSEAVHAKLPHRSVRGVRTRARRLKLVTNFHWRREL